MTGDIRIPVGVPAATEANACTVEQLNAYINEQITSSERTSYVYDDIVIPIGVPGASEPRSCTVAQLKKDSIIPNNPDLLIDSLFDNVLIPVRDPELTTTSVCTVEQLKNYIGGGNQDDVLFLDCYEYTDIRFPQWRYFSNICEYLNISSSRAEKLFNGEYSSICITSGKDIICRFNRTCFYNRDRR